MSLSDQRTNRLLCSPVGLGVPFPGSQPGNGSRTGETTLVGAAVASADSSAGSTWGRAGGLEPACVHLRWRLGCRHFPNPSLWCSVSSSVGVLQAPGSEMPIIIENMIRMCIPGTGHFLLRSFPAQGGSKQGSVLLGFFFSFISFWALWMGGGGREQKRNLLKLEELRLPHFWSMLEPRLGSALLSTLVALLAGVEHPGAGQTGQVAVQSLGALPAD